MRLTRAALEEARQRAVNSKPKPASRGHSKRSPLPGVNEALAEIRILADLSQAALGVGLGITRVQVSNIERGWSLLPLERFVAWCVICGKEPGEVLTEALKTLDEGDE